ncbi:MAG: class I SAM-dependent methyltransferase [Candidatus Eisenbacteria bacterium]|nr:class I SAM-dependent methyltransferase [Candidatus Eisenbacteria bacterium]
MRPGEHEVMARVEADHWWYLGLRDAVARSLGTTRLAVPPHPKVLDAGCGTGENLKFLNGLLRPSYLGGFDSDEEALVMARKKIEGVDVYQSDICDPVIHVDDLDLLVSLDVIYIPGAERSLNGLRRLVASLRRGGLFVLNLPAHPWLYSEHDVAVHTSQRFTSREVASLLDALGLSAELLTHRLFFLFPAVVLSRLPGIWRARRGGDLWAARSDLHTMPGRRLNRLLFGILRAENELIARGARFPWGSSLFAIGRKV